MKNENMEQVMKAQEHDISDVSEEVIVEAGKAIGNETAKGYKKIENAVVSGYKKIENGVVDGFNKVTNKCVEVLFAKEGETVEETKSRLSGKGEETNEENG